MLGEKADEAGGGDQANHGERGRRQKGKTFTNRQSIGVSGREGATPKGVASIEDALAVVRLRNGWAREGPGRRKDTKWKS